MEQGGTVPPGHPRPRRSSRSVGHPTGWGNIENYEDSNGESDGDNYYVPNSEEVYESKEIGSDSNDEESGEGSDVARGPQVPHKQQIPRVTVSKNKPKIHSKSKLTTKINTRSAESQNRGEYQYEEFVRRFGQYVDITSEGLHKCTLCEYVNPPKGKGRENGHVACGEKAFP